MSLFWEVGLVLPESSYTQHSNTPQEKVNPQDSNYYHLNRPGASIEGDSRYLPFNHDKRGSGAENKNKLTNAPQVGGRAGGTIQKREVQGEEEHCCFQLIYMFFTLTCHREIDCLRVVSDISIHTSLWMYAGAIAPSGDLYKMKGNQFGSYLK